MKTIRLIIVDDHPVVREGLRGMLASQPDFEVAGDAPDGRAGVALAEEVKPDVVLMDLRMPDADGVSAIAELKTRDNPARVLVLTTYDSDADIVRAVEAGATGYLLKDAPREELFKAIRAAAQGQAVLAPTVATRLMGRMSAPKDDTLSVREIEVLELVARGNSNKAVGRALHISEATVKTHLIHIYGKLGVNDRTAAVTVALERGILSLD